MKDSVFHHLDIRYTGSGKLSYIVRDEQQYFSKRYSKWITCEVGMPSDGATGALDIDSYSWLFHDKIKATKKFDVGSDCPNSKASFIIYDILKSEGCWFRARSWYLSTLLWGSVVK